MGIVAEQHQNPPQVPAVKLPVTIDLQDAIRGIREAPPVGRHQARSMPAVHRISDDLQLAGEPWPERSQHLLGAIRRGVVDHDQAQ